MGFETFINRYPWVLPVIGVGTLIAIFIPSGIRNYQAYKTKQNSLLDEETPFRRGVLNDLGKGVKSKRRKHKKNASKKR